MEFRETLDTGVEFRQWLYGNGLEAKYSFAMVRTPRGLQMAPPDIPLGDKSSDEKRKEIEIEFGAAPPHLFGLLFVVEFSPLESEEPIRSKGFRIDTDRIVGMHFHRRECKLEFQPIGKRFYWRPVGDASDRDEGDLSASDALKVFAGVNQVALKYYEEHMPDGILMGTRTDANDSRGRIYRRIAERVAATKGGSIITPEDSRHYEMKNLTLVWFPGVFR